MAVLRERIELRLPLQHGWLPALWGFKMIASDVTQVQLHIHTCPDDSDHPFRATLIPFIQNEPYFSPESVKAVRTFERAIFACQQLTAQARREDIDCPITIWIDGDLINANQN